jgi:small-conductance mechanosensitive channel
MLAVLGIAFFAQWSLLSNITAGIILFFNHPLKIGDTITIFDKDFNIAGKITNIGLFFMHIRNESNEKITIPNSILLQKMVIINHHND